MPALRYFTCNICDKSFSSSVGLLRHTERSADHQGVGLVDQNLPSYADPDFERTAARNHDPEWDHRPEEVAEFGGGDGASIPEEDELDEGEPDQIFEGAGIPFKSIILSFKASQTRMDRESQSLGRKPKLCFRKPVVGLRTVDIDVGGIRTIPDNNFDWRDETSSR
jgi:hypothetical protein